MWDTYFLVRSRALCFLFTAMLLQPSALSLKGQNSEAQGNALGE
jgi:hypothetical protein